ncbi:Oxidoreductase (NAD-binding), involved in siderophore biosynthesis [Citrobacter freundii]|nr:Oxidoreductase (NAD-binding), involved in siderophore biosynthesis [Citrobacter freundii]
MMPSASPKQRVLIVGAKFGEMYLNAFMQPPGGAGTGRPAGAGKRPLKRAWPMRLAFRCIPRRNR